MGETPFTLAFDTEAVILAEIEVLSHKTMSFGEQENDRALALSLDLLEKKRIEADLKNTMYK